MTHQLKFRDAILDVTEKQKELIKAIAKEKSISCETNFDKNFPDLVYSGSTICPTDTNNNYSYIPFETFIQRMLGLFIEPKEEVKPVKMKSQLVEGDRICNVSREQADLIESIAKKEGIRLGAQFKASNYPSNYIPHISITFGIICNSSVNSGFISFEEFISKMLGVYVEKNIKVSLNVWLNASVFKGGVAIDGDLAVNLIEHSKIKELYEASCIVSALKQFK